MPLRLFHIASTHLLAIKANIHNESEYVTVPIVILTVIITKNEKVH